MRSSFLLVYFTFATSSFAADSLDAANLDAQIIDQKPIHAMGCGPIALLNAYRLGSDAWRETAQKVTATPQQGFKYFTKTYCSRFSRNSYLKRRWDEKNGIRPDDLTEAINEFHKKVKLPQVSLKRLFIKGDQSHQDLLLELHSHIKKSIKHGFPPLLSISKFSRITTLDGGDRWAETGSHFITITSIPKELAVNAQNFNFAYADPWLGKLSNTHFTISSSPFFANDITNRKDKRLHKNPTLVVPKTQFTLGTHRLSSNIAQQIAVTHLIVADSAATINIRYQSEL